MRTKPIGHLSDAAETLALRVAKKAQGMGTSTIREFTVWADRAGNIFAARSDSTSAMYAERDGSVIGVYRVSVPKKASLADDKLAHIEGDISEEQRIRGIRPMRAAA